MDTFKHSIRKKYRERRINTDERQWPPSRLEQLVELELVEDEKGRGYTGNQLRDHDRKASIKRTPLACSDIFEGGRKRPIRRVLLEGEGGVGKTTFCTSISADWSDMNLFPQFELVLLLPLRHEIVASANCLSGLLQLLHLNQQVRDSVVDYLEKNEGERVLIIADGWDELIVSQRREKSFLYRLLLGELLPFVSVLLTSRPSASTMLHELQCIDRYVEVCGFSKKGIQEYIQTEFANDKAKARRLLEQLENNPLIESVCSIPLNCAIVCHLWRTLEGALPTTMTELYSKIILNLVLRNALKKSASESQGVQSLCNFEALPEALHNPWKSLCKLAFQAISENKIAFSEEELTEFSQPGSALNQKILCFGLLQAAESILDVGRGTSFHFLHQTFQEYLAALYLVKLSPAEQLDFCKKRGKSDHISMLWRFYFGISFQSSQAVSIKLQKCLFGELLYSQKLTICHCALESQNENVTCFVAELLGAGELRLINPRNVNDCFAMINVIINTQDSKSVVIDLVNCNLSDTHIIFLSDALVSKCEKLQIEELNLSDNKVTDKGINLLIQKTPDVFSSLKMLDLSNNKIGGKGIGTVLTTLASTNSGVTCLTGISLWYNPLGISGFKVLEKAIRDDSLVKLEMLHLQGSLTDDIDTNSAILISFTEALLAHCPAFEYIDLSENALGVAGASAIGAAISQLAHRTVGFGISLNEAKLGDEGVSAFVQSLNGTCPLSVLAMKGNDIHSAGGSYLAEAIISGQLQLITESTLHSELSLDKNPLGVEGVLAIGNMLSSSHCQLSRLSLSECQLATTTSCNLGGDATEELVDSVGKQLCELQPNETITQLFVDGNSFTDKGIYIFAGLIRSCTSIKDIFSNNCKITSDGLTNLLDYLAGLEASSSIKVCSMLDTWHLRENILDDSGACSLVEHQLSLLNTAQCIDIYDNPDVSSHLAIRLHGDKPSTILSDIMIIDQLLPIGTFVTTEMQKKLQDSDEVSR